MAKQFTLGKQERLKSRKLIEDLFSNGTRVGLYPYRVFYLFQKKEGAAPEASLQCGAGAGTRSFKKAVDRNRIKRVTREAWRLQKEPLAQKMKEHPCRLLLFFIYTGKELPAGAVVKEKIALIIQKLLIIADENRASHP
ncbi:MAG: ribonuclease P protein component [Bacteroidota bacterium]